MMGNSTGFRFSLHEAIQHRNAVSAKLGHNTANLDVNTLDKKRNAPLHLAIERGLDDWVEFLLANRADPNIKNKFELSPLMLAARHQHSRITQLLLQNGADPQYANAQGQTALHYACATNNEDVVMHLLQHKAKLNIQDQDGVTPAIMACKMRKPKILQILLSHKTVAKTNPNMSDKEKRTPLHWAAELNEAESARALIKAHADMHEKDIAMETPFVRGIKQNSLEVLDVLISAGCDRSDIDGLNGTAMTMAALLGHNEVIKRLVDAGEDLDELGHIGHTPLTAAIFECQVETVKLLLDYGADPDLISRIGTNPLVHTVAYLRQCQTAKRHEITKLLLRANADPNHRVNMAGYFTMCTNGRNCALSFALGAGCTSSVQMHLIAGSDITVAEVSEWILNNESKGSFEVNNILRIVYDWAKSTRTLKFLCRQTIRKILNTRVQLKIKELPVPTVIKRYLDFDELDSIQLECADWKSSISREFPILKAVPPCGLRSLEGTLSYELFGAPARGFDKQ